VAPGARASTMGRAAAVAVLALLAGGCGGDGESSTRFGETQELGETRQVEVTFESRGDTLVGTLKVPSADGTHPALIWVHGSGEEARDTTSRFYTDLLDRRFAVFAFDKRGVGESDGRCCPLDFDLLADDVLAAVDALRSRDDVDDERIGLLGLSQGGWIIPVAATKSDDVSFAIVLSGSAVSVGEEGLYSGLTGDVGCIPSGTPPALVSRLLREAKPSEFDPRPYLERLDIPVLWLYGANDMSQPVEKDLTVLEPLRQGGKEFEVVVFPDADHALLQCGGGAFVPELQSTMHTWLREHVR
jgi:pimeloyl-ACP methyl ester carboxylesterase